MSLRGGKGEGQEARTGCEGAGVWQACEEMAGGGGLRRQASGAFVLAWGGLMLARGGLMLAGGGLRLVQGRLLRIRKAGNVERVLWEGTTGVQNEASLGSQFLQP